MQDPKFLDHTLKGVRVFFKLRLEGWEYQKLRSAKMRAKISWNFSRDPDTGYVRFSHPTSHLMEKPQMNLAGELSPILGSSCYHDLERI
jgi:hypothetical protein